MELNELFDERFITINTEPIDQKTLLGNTCGKLLDAGYVAEGYLEELLERESEYPTGLKLPSCGIAIPHCSPKNVRESVIYVNLLKKNADWKNMEDFEETIPVGLTFNLVLSDKEDHMSVLSSMIALIQNEELVNDIIRCDDEKKIIETLRKGTSK